MEDRARVDELRSLALFRHLPEGRLEELTRVLGARTAPAGEVVFEEGSPGDVFGEMALIESVPRSARAVAQSDAPQRDHVDQRRQRCDAPGAKAERLQHSILSYAFPSRHCHGITHDSKYDGDHHK